MTKIRSTILNFTVKPQLPFTTMLTSSSGMTGAGLALAMAPIAYSEAIAEFVSTMQYLIENIPVVSGLFQDAQRECGQLGIQTDYAFFKYGSFPEYPREYTMQEYDAVSNAGDLMEDIQALDAKIHRFGVLAQELHRHSELHPGSVGRDLEVQAVWARARGL